MNVVYNLKFNSFAKVFQFSVLFWVFNVCVCTPVYKTEINDGRG
jgi:hypothetical protein